MTAAASLRMVQGNCFDVLATFAEASFDACLTDPPYNTTELAFDQEKIDWEAWWKQINRVCRPNAVIVCFTAQPFTTDLIQSNRRGFRYDLIWHKTTPVGFLSANKRPLRAHEHILVFSRRPTSVKHREYPLSIYNPQFTQGTPYFHRARARPARHYSGQKGDVSYQNDGRRYPTSVLTYARDAKIFHPTQKPLELMRWLVRSFTHAHQRVLDPFAGGGSTGVACQLEGREFVGIEQDAAYYAIAKERLGLP